MPQSACNPKSSSSSDSSEVCYKVKCEPACKEKCCEVKECPALDPQAIICQFGSAVVDIHSEFILLGSATGTSGTVAAPTDITPLAYNSRVDLVVNGNGFFVKGHYIVAPASLVLLPPSLTSPAVRYPFQDANRLAGGPIQSKMVRASRILVTVREVNNRQHSFVYEASLIGVDGAGNIAVLKIDCAKQWNLCNPKIQKCHPYLQLGSSRASRDGEHVFVLGSGQDNSQQLNSSGIISEGLLADHRYVDQSGFALPEQVLVSADSVILAAGAPILNGQGQVIGMQTTNYTQMQDSTIGFSAGPSEFFFQRVIKALIKGSCTRKCNQQVAPVSDPAGSYLRYLKAYAGVAYDVLQGQDYDTVTDYTSGASPLGQPRVRLDANGLFLSSPTSKQIIGIRVLGLAGANPDDALAVADGFWYVPGGTGSAGTYLASPLPVSSLLGTLHPGDVITHLGNVALGDLAKQCAPSLITWRQLPTDVLDVTYRTGGAALNSASSADTDNYDTLESTQITLGEFPLVMDYPWYAASQFPALSGSGGAYPGFFNLAALQVAPRFPALAAGAPFHPAF
jgi:S1-C subfamily serine protease